MLDRRCTAVIFPIRGNRSHAVRADRNDLASLGLLERIQVLFRHLLKQEIVAQPPRRVASTTLLPQDTIRGPQVIHHPRKGSDDLAAARIVRAHAAEPQAILLRSIEDRELLLLNEFGALRWA